MKFSEILNECIENSFPDGLPSNLRKQARNAVVDALITAQKYCIAPGKSIGYYQQSHLEVYQQCHTWYYGGMTVVPAPNGQITSVYTNIEKAQFCRVDYTELNSLSQLRYWVNTWGPRHLNAAYNGVQPEPGFSQTYPGGKMFGRAGWGHFTIEYGKVYIAPYIEENEQVCIEWTGLKTVWDDEDEVIEWRDRELIKYIELYMAYDLYSRWYQDTQQAALLFNRSREALAELIESAIDKQKAHETASKNPTRTSLVQCAFQTPECYPIDDGTIAVQDGARALKVAFVGDIQPEPGEDLSDELAVEKMIIDWNPAAVILGGDLREYGETYLGVFEKLTGYKSLINSSNLIKNRLWPVLGNHDINDSGGLGEWNEYFSWLPNNKRFYEFRVGPVHFFVLNSYKEPEGITEDSPQAEWLKIKSRASNARWKIVVLHVPPYSSMINYESLTVNGVPLRWPYLYYGIDLVMSGHVHNYERIVKDRVTYIVSGTGGERPFAQFGQPISGSMFRYNQGHGALKLLIDCERIIGQFYTINDPTTPLDTFEIVKP